MPAAGSATTSADSPPSPASSQPCWSSARRAAGRVVEVSLLRTGAYVLGWDLSLQANLGKVAPAEPRQSNQTPLMNSYRTKDGRWFFFTCLEADRHLDNVVRALGREGLRTTRASRARGRCARTAARSSPSWTRSSPPRPLDVWAERFEREGVWWAPAQGPAQVLEDPQLAANDAFVELYDEGRRDPAVRQRPGHLLGRTGAAVHAGPAPRPAHRRGAGGAGGAGGAARAPDRSVSPDRGPGRGGRGR